jgi:hypothetical protein
MQPMQTRDLNIHPLLRAAKIPSTKLPIDNVVVDPSNGISPSNPLDAANITDFASQEELICALIDIVQGVILSCEV